MSMMIFGITHLIHVVVEQQHPASFVCCRLCRSVQVVSNVCPLSISTLGLQEKLKRMNPEQRAKAEARQERIQSKRAMKQRMIRA